MLRPMHSSPSLALLLGRAPAAAFIVMGALVGSGCQDSSEPAGQTPGASMPAERDAATFDASASTQSSSMTRVGAPSTSTGASGAKAPAAEDAGPPDPMRRDPSTPSTPAAPDLSCSADSACKTVDSTCGSCRCLILPAAMEPPACTGPKVTCIVAPCLNKRAVCSSAMCALQDEGPNAM